ncbi:MAG: hypothetical protein JNL74_11500, partial [Fibrobacteres bacterium]|nr:hypothetical protein [Fibrobacterota bacterium]
MFKQFFSLSLIFLIQSIYAVKLDTLPANQWKELLTKDQSFNLNNWTYENDAHADPVNGVLWIGPGHRGSPQDNIMYAYEPLAESISTAHSALPPAKSCLRHFVFTPQDTAILMLGGVTGHQNSTGFFDDSFKKITDRLWIPYGFYYYSINKSRWLHIKTPGNSFGVGAYRPRFKYDPVHDVIIYNLSGKTGIYNFHQNAWHTITATGPGTRIDQAVAVDEKRGLFYLLGGTSKSYCNDAVNDMWVLDPETELWTKLPAFSVNPWEIMPTCIDYNTSMAYSARSDVIMFTARDGAVYTFDCETKDWSRMTSASTPLKCSGHMAYESRNNLFYLLGGSNAPQGINDQRTTQGLWVCKYENANNAIWNAKLTAPDATIEITATSNTIRWQTSQDIKFNIYRANAVPYPKGFVKLNSSPVTGNSYVDNSAVVGTAYSYRVVAVDNNGLEGHYSRHLYSSPARPLFAAASVETPTLVKVSWEPNTDPGIVGYHVYRGKGSAIYSTTFSYTKLTTTPVAATEFLDSVDLTDSIARGYVVTAVNVQGIESGLSPLTTTFPEPPLNFRSFKKQGTAIYSAWSGHSLVGPNPADSTILFWQPPARTKIAGINMYRGGTY